MPRRRCPACDQSADAQFSTCEFCGHVFADAPALPAAPLHDAATLDPAIAAAAEERRQEYRAIEAAVFSPLNPARAVSAVIAARRAARGPDPGVALRAKIAAAIAVLIALFFAGLWVLQFYAIETAPARADKRMREMQREVEAITGPIPNDSDLADAAAITRIENDLDHDRIPDVAVSAREVKVFRELREAAGAGRVNWGQLYDVNRAIDRARADHMVDPDEASAILDKCDRILATPAAARPATSP